MDENVWQCVQILMWFFGIQTTILIAVMGGFYSALNKKIEKNGEKIDAVEKKLEHKIDAVEKNLEQKIDSVEEKLEQKIDAVEKKLEQKIDAVEKKLEQKIEAIDISLRQKIDVVDANLQKKIDALDKNIQSMTTRMAVFESKLTDISTNVTHLMWHNQAFPHKEMKEE